MDGNLYMSCEILLCSSIVDNVIAQDICEGKTTRIPEYDCKTNSRVRDKSVIIRPSQIDVVLVEGILVFYCPKVFL